MFENNENDKKEKEKSRHDYLEKMKGAFVNEIKKPSNFRKSLQPYCITT